MTTGIVEKTTVGAETRYRIGDMLIVAQAPIPELEEKIGRNVVLRVEEGFPLRQTLVKGRHHDYTGGEHY